MNKLYSFLIFLFSQSILLAQQPNLTTLELDSTAAAFAAQQQYDEAINYAKSAIAQAQAQVGKQDSLYAKVLERLGVIYYDMYRDAEAGAIFEQVANIYKHTHGTYSYEYANALKSVGVIESSLKNYEKAEYIYQQIEPIYLQIHGEKSAEYAFLLGDFAVLYDNWHKEELAESMYLRAIEIEEIVLEQHSLEHALSLSNFAVFYGRYGHYEKAISLYKKALAIYKKKLGTDHSKYAHTLGNLAISYQHTEQYETSIELHKQAMLIYAQIYGKQHSRYAFMLNQLATTYMTNKEYAKAEELYLESFAIHESLQTSPTQRIVFYQKLTHFYSSTGQLAKALEYGFKSIANNAKGAVDSSSLEQLIKTASQSTFRKPQMALYTISAIADAFFDQYLKDNDPKWLYKSQFCYNAILAYMNSYKNNFAFNRDKLRVLKMMSPFIQDQIQTLLVLNQLDSTKNYLDNIFGLVEQNKSILLMDALQNRKNKNFGNLPDSLLQKEAKLRVQFDELQKIKLTSTDPAQLSTITQKLLDVNTQISDFATYLKTNYPKYYTFNYSPQNIDLAQTQALLKPKELLVEYFIGKKFFYILTIHKNGIACKSVAFDENRLKQLIHSFRKSLSDYTFITADPPKAFREFCISSSALYQLLLGPIAAELKDIKELTIIPDGLLGHVPFEVLLTEPTQSFQDFKEVSYLIKKYSLRYSYSAALLSENYQAPQEHTSHKMLGIAASYQQQVDSNLLAKNYRSYKDLGLRKILKPLPAAIQEVNMLSRHFDGQFITGKSATEAFFKKEAPSYGIIHLAMHGVLDWNYPILSNMAFTEDHDSLSDNFLYTSEISNMDLNANLVVLSACETGFGKFKQGEGILSLARSFMYAGVPSLVVSLWQVNDASTTKIMNLFYKSLAKNLDKATALQEAKLNYLQAAKGIAAHPAFWAPFIQLGNKMPITIETKQSYFWWYLIGGIVTISGLLMLFVRFFAPSTKQE